MIKSEGYKLIEKIQNFGSQKGQLFFDEINTLFEELKITEKSKSFICTLTNNVSELGIILCSRKVFKLEKKDDDLFVKLVVQNDDLYKIPFDYVNDYQYYNDSTFIKVKFEDYFEHKGILFPLLINSLKLDKCEKTQYLSSHSKLFYKVITNNKKRASAFDCIDINLKDWKTYLINLTQSQNFQNIIQDTEFSLEKGRQAFKDVKTEFEKYGIDKLPLLASKIDKEFDKLEGNGKTLQLLDLLNESEKKLIEKINVFYAYVDDKALNKRELNEYDDTRVMAKTNYAQKQFIVDWLRYVSDSSIGDKQIALIRILNFFESPENNFSMISEGHRKSINTHLFDNKLTITETDDKAFINEFSFLNLNLANEENKGFLITRLLYDPKFKLAFWLHSKEIDIKISNLKQLIEALKQKQIEDDFKSFDIQFDNKNRNLKGFNWFSEVNSIQQATKECHYEIFVSGGDKVHLDIHFENEETNEKYYSVLKDIITTTSVKWFDWDDWKGKTISKSIRHNNIFKYSDKNLIDNVIDSLKELIEVGKLVAKVIQTNDEWVWTEFKEVKYDKNTLEKYQYWQRDFVSIFNIPAAIETIKLEYEDEVFENIRIDRKYKRISFNVAEKGRFLDNESIKKCNHDDLIKIRIGYIKIKNKLDMENNSHPLNKILFGPPGTGKTYKTKELAVRIIDGNAPTDREELRTRYKELIESKQIQFTTFHQSMSYEDFVEGLKPKLTNDEDKNESSDIEYEIKNGIFKDMCLNAESFKEYTATENKFNLIETDFLDKNIFKVSLGNTLKSTGNKVYEYCRDNNCIALGWGGDINYSKVKTRKEIIEQYQEDSGLIPSPSDFNIRAINHFKLNMQIGDLVFISHGNKLLKAVGKIVGEYEYDSKPIKGYYHYRKVEWFFTDITIPITKAYEIGFSQQSIYEMHVDKIKIPFFTKQEATKQKDESNNVVLIIDEINRGNVSAIFGELITLIEEDKRKGENEEIEVILPYSKKPFSVPSNLHIIGTMNTADRSVEALDTALRRRFSFTEIAPDSELIKTVGKLKESDGVIKEHKIDLVKILDTINRRIEKLIDKDHKIGHSYFLSISNIQDLREVFQKNIIPLLQEYFFGDFGKIGLVIGSGFYTTKENEINEDNFFAEVEDYDFGGLYEKKTYDFINVSDMDDDKFKKAIDKLLRN